MEKKPIPPLYELLKEYLAEKETNSSWRLGQHFVSRYCKNTWLELFNAKDTKALDIIRQFYKDTQTPSGLKIGD